MKKIILDCLGGDNPQEELAMGVYLCRDMPLDFVLVGEEAKLRPLFEATDMDMSRLEFIDASTTLPNDADPRVLIKGGEEMSLVKAMNRLNEDDAVAYIGAGSTGGVLLASIFRLGLLPGIRFPGLGCFMYNIHGGKVCLLDCGANIDMQAHLVPKFASLGNTVVKHYLGKENPRIALLNLGKEEHKGNAFCKEAYGLLKESGLNFVGNIEGSDILLDTCDIVLCDGFAGNVALKAIESTALICKQMALGNGDAFTADQIDRNFHYTTRGASMVFGAKKIVLKPHGSGDRNTFAASITLACEMAEKGVVEALREEHK